jgi:hypothetical protein
VRRPQQILDALLDAQHEHREIRHRFAIGVDAEDRQPVLGEDRDPNRVLSGQGCDRMHFAQQGSEGIPRPLRSAHACDRQIEQPAAIQHPRQRGVDQRRRESRQVDQRAGGLPAP